MLKENKLPNDREIFPEIKILEIFEDHFNKEKILLVIEDINKDFKQPFMTYMDYLANYRNLIRNELLFPIYDDLEDNDDSDEEWYYEDINNNFSIIWSYLNYTTYHKNYIKDIPLSESIVKELIILDKGLAKEQARIKKNN
jgi:hypothetical protein